MEPPQQHRLYVSGIDEQPSNKAASQETGGMIADKQLTNKIIKTRPRLNGHKRDPLRRQSKPR
jgi:hypothetical protein